jgi:hypothetical protein
MRELPPAVAYPETAEVRGGLDKPPGPIPEGKWMKSRVANESSEESEEIEVEPVAGRWQEELEYSVYADSSMTLPGRGDVGEKCGEYYPSEFCDECGEPHFGMNHCEQRVCPNCASIWTADRARGITERLAAAREAEPAGVDKRAVHATMSPPAGAITSIREVYDGFREAYELAREKGVRGGVVVFHGFRVREEVQEEYREADPDMGIWHWILEERAESWRELTYWSPHYHIIGLCREFEADDPSEQDGWVARRLRSLERYEGVDDLEALEDMVGAARYILSHATFEADTQRDCVRWYGELATTKFQPESELSERALSRLEENVAEVVGSSEESGEGEREEPECENCGATSRSPIWEAGAALQDPGWCDRIGREQQRRLTAAFEWAIGERKPPPGLQCPQTEAEARESLEALL